MSRSLKTLALGAALAAGLVLGSAVYAEDNQGMSSPEMRPDMRHGGMMGMQGNMMAQMSQMMARCNSMMQSWNRLPNSQFRKSQRQAD